MSEVKPTDDILCVLAHESSPHHTDDSVVIDTDCGHRAWVAPVMKSKLDDPAINTKTMCIPCACEDEEVIASVQSQGLHAFRGQREEIQQELGKEATDDLYTRWEVRETDL